MAKKIDEETLDETPSKRGRKKGKNYKKVELKDDARYSIWGIGFIVLGILFTLSIFNDSLPPAFNSQFSPDNITVTLNYIWKLYDLRHLF